MNLDRITKEIRLLRFATRVTRVLKVVRLISVAIPLFGAARLILSLSRR